VPEAGGGGLGGAVLAEPALEAGQVRAGDEAKRACAGRAGFEVRPEGDAADVRSLAGMPGGIAGKAGGDPGRRQVGPPSSSAEDWNVLGPSAMSERLNGALLAARGR
jgi:hypothetical protein